MSKTQTSSSNIIDAENTDLVIPKARVIIIGPSKGGVGKSSVGAGLIDWFEKYEIPVSLVDMDPEIDKNGCLKSFRKDGVLKIDPRTEGGMVSLIDRCTTNSPIVLADLGAGSGQSTFDFLELLHSVVAEDGIVFTIILVITPDSASVMDALNWATKLQDKVSYIVIRNKTKGKNSEFSYWDQTTEAQEFVKLFNPATITMEYRLNELENGMRNYGLTLGDIANRRYNVPSDFRKYGMVALAKAYYRDQCAEYDKVKDLLLI